jgi:hypothetical protein
MVESQMEGSESTMKRRTWANILKPTEIQALLGASRAEATYCAKKSARNAREGYDSPDLDARYEILAALIGELEESLHYLTTLTPKHGKVLEDGHEPALREATFTDAHGTSVTTRVVETTNVLSRWCDRCQQASRSTGIGALTDRVTNCCRNCGAEFPSVGA